MKNTICFIILLLSFKHAHSQVDVHVHAYSHTHKNTLKYLEGSAKNGIKKSFVFSHAYAANVRTTQDISFAEITIDEYITLENNYIADLQKEFPDQVDGFCSVPWKYENTEKEIARCAKLGLKGLKVYPTVFKKTTRENPDFDGSTFANISGDIEDQSYLRLLYELCDKYNLTMGIHSSYFTPNDVLSFVFQSGFSKYPNVNIIFLHGFTVDPFQGFFWFNQYLKFMGKNIFIEFSDNFQFYSKDNPVRQKWQEAVLTVEKSQVLFGSDIYSSDDPSYQQTMMDKYIQIFGQDDFKQILNENPKTLFTRAK